MAETFIDIKANHLDDRALVERFKQTGDPAWFASLFERHRGRIYALCCVLVENRALAEDLTQETFMKAFEEINRFDEQDPGSEFPAWLCSIGRHLCLDELRRMKRRRDYEMSAPRSSGPDPQTSEGMLLLHQLAVELEALPEEARCCWLLFYADGYTYEEIVRLTGYSFHQVKNNLHLARRELKRRLT